MNHDLGARSVRVPNFKPSPTTITSVNTARIADLLAPFLREQLSDLHLTQISTYIDLLLRWNARTNLTAIRDPESIVTRHFGESLFAAQTLFPTPAPAPKNTASTHPVADSIQADASAPTRTDAGTVERVDAGAPACVAERSSAGLTPSAPPDQLVSTPATLDLLDIGSGAGFPGLPIKLWSPNLLTTLLESQNKKVVFLREAVRALTLTDINVSPERAEQFAGHAKLVTLRAVEHFGTILPTAATRVAPEGRLALLIGESQIPQTQALANTLQWNPPIPIPLAKSRILLLGVNRQDR